MRKGCFLLMLALSGPGCLSSGTHVESEARQTTPPRMVEPPPPPISADQVTESNAADSAQALARELDSESHTGSAAPAMASTTANTIKP
jgi:hypothetical protein